MLDSKTHIHTNLYSPIRVRSIFWYPRRYHDNRCRCCVPLSFRAAVANISLTLYLFSPDSAKVLIQFPNTLVASAHNTSRKEVLKDYLLRVECIECFNKTFLKVLFSQYIYLTQSRVFPGGKTRWRLGGI